MISVIIPSSSDSANFWFYARLSIHSEAVATEKSFPVVPAPSSRALLVDTFAEIERSIDTVDGNAEACSDWGRQYSQPESLNYL